VISRNHRLGVVSGAGAGQRFDRVIRSLAELGVADIEPGDPMEWERLRQADRPRPAYLLRGTAP
jgi:16S rRNA U1498 N3-methylase RsmE